MTVYRVRGPDGLIHRFDGPEGATPEQVVSIAVQQFSQKPEAQYDPTQGMSGTELLAAGGGKALADTGLGLRQRLAEVQDYARPPQMGQVDPARPSNAQAMQQQVNEASARDAPLMRRGEAMAGNIAANVGIMAAPGGALRTLGAAADLPKVAALGKELIAPKSITGAGVLGAEMSGIQPTTSEESPVTNAGLGLLGGSAGQIIGKTAGALIRGVDRQPNAVREGLIDAAKNQRIPLTVAQVTGSKPLSYLESAMENMPFTSGKMEQVREAQRTAFNQAALRTLGVDADKATPEILNEARTRLNGEFNRLTKGRDIEVGTKTFFDAIAGVDENNAKTWESLRSPKVASVIDDALDQFGKGQISSEEYQRVRSSLTQQAKDAFGSKNSQLGQALKGIRNALDDAAHNSLDPKDQAAWQLARQQWANLKTVEEASVPVSEDAALGNVSRQKLAVSVNRNNPQGLRYGTGDQRLPSLARLGQGLMKPEPNSGTAQRAMMQKLLTLGYGGTGATLAGYGASGTDESNRDALLAATLLFAGPKAIQAGYMNPLSTRVLTQGVAGRSPISLAIARALQASSVGSGVLLPIEGGQ